MAALQGAGTPAPGVWVGNLPYDLTEQGMADYFGQCGPVKSVRIVMDHNTGRSRGFGFVEYYDIPTAESAIRNLSGKELNGRVLRVVFLQENVQHEHRAAGPGAGPRGGGYGAPSMGYDRNAPIPGRPSNTSRVIGGDLAYHSALGASQLLGGVLQPGDPADALTKLLARRSRQELYALLAQVQQFARRDRQAARDLLVANPALCRALFQSQIILGYISNPRGDVAPKGIAPPGTMPGRGFPTTPGLEPGPEPATGYGGGNTAGYGGGNTAGYGGGNTSGYGGGPSSYNPSPQQHEQQQQSHGGGPGPMVSMAHHQPQPSYGGAAQTYGSNGYNSGGGGYEAAGGPLDPRQRGFGPTGGPAPSFTADATPTPGPAEPSGGMTPAQQQALLQQVLSLTPAQLEQLPPDQKAQVLALQQQMTGR